MTDLEVNECVAAVSYMFIFQIFFFWNITH